MEFKQEVKLLIENNTNLLMIGHKLTRDNEFNNCEDFTIKSNNFNQNNIYYSLFCVKCNISSIQYLDNLLILSVIVDESINNSSNKQSTQFNRVSKGSAIQFIITNPNFNKSFYELFSYYFLEHKFINNNCVGIYKKDELTYVDCYLETRIFNPYDTQLHKVINHSKYRSIMKFKKMLFLNKDDYILMSVIKKELLKIINGNSINTYYSPTLTVPSVYDEIASKL